MDGLIEVFSRIVEQFTRLNTQGRPVYKIFINNHHSTKWTVKNMNRNDLCYKDFPLQSYDKIRYCDTDRQGHVNNALFSTFLETGRTELLYGKEPLHTEDCAFVIAHQRIDLLSEITWPGTVEIGTAVVKVGNSSLTLFQGLFQNELLVARPDTVIVQMNESTRKSQALSPITKEELTKYSASIENE
ncbi:thioesterase family protein [Priestia koreensis]|uniref:acyl-CoA thioesterase n=1 Tax=Priestia koreensis TaxID=284581 RepID=UPI0030178C09